MTNSPCQAYIEPIPGGFAYQCDLPLHHKGEHRAAELMISVGERPRGGKARRETTVTMRWR